MILENLFSHLMFFINFVNYLELSNISQSDYQKQISNLRAKQEVQFSYKNSSTPPRSWMLNFEITNWNIQTQSSLAFGPSQTLFFFTETINSTIVAISTLLNAFIVNFIKNPQKMLFKMQCSVGLRCICDGPDENLNLLSRTFFS